MSKDKKEEPESPAIRGVSGLFPIMKAYAPVVTV